MKLTKSGMVLATSVCFGLLLSQALTCKAARTYRIPTHAQLQQGEELFSWLFSGKFQSRARTSAIELGFRWQETATDITLLDEKKRGWGNYRFSKIANSSIALQAPHRYYDKHTGSIVRLLFDQQGFSSTATNSLSRHTPVDNSAALTADLAHLPDSFHSVYSRAFAARYPQGKLIQLHGFNANKRLSPEAQQANIILSTGSSWSSAYLLDIQKCFIGQGWHSLRYPQQVRELGATQNSIGALLRNLGHSGFTHIELDLDTREELTSNSTRLESFASCLLEPSQ